MFFQVIRLLSEVVFGESRPDPCSLAPGGRSWRILHAAALLISRSAPGLELRRPSRKRRVLCSPWHWPEKFVLLQVLPAASRKGGVVDQC